MVRRLRRNQLFPLRPNGYDVIGADMSFVKRFPRVDRILDGEPLLIVNNGRLSPRPHATRPYR